jgi:hypothetical protein
MTMSDETQKEVTLYILGRAIDMVYDAHMKGPCRNKDFMDSTESAIEALKKARRDILEVKE